MAAEKTLTSIIPDVSLVDNTSQRLPCVIALDGSKSMEGDPIDQLNQGLKILEQDLKADDLACQRVQVLVIRFGDDDQAHIVTPWTDAMDFQAPTIEANGRTPMGVSMRLALSEIEDQKARYRAHGIAYNRPWLFLITDGAPTDPDWQEAAEECRRAEQGNKVTIFPIGVQNANMAILQQFSNRRPARLRGLNFRQLFVWLSRSARSASRSEAGATAQMAVPDEWMHVDTSTDT